MKEGREVGSNLGANEDLALAGGYGEAAFLCLQTRQFWPLTSGRALSRTVMKLIRGIEDHGDARSVGRTRRACGLRVQRESSAPDSSELRSWWT